MNGLALALALALAQAPAALETAPPSAVAAPAAAPAPTPAPETVREVPAPEPAPRRRIVPGGEAGAAPAAAPSPAVVTTTARRRSAPPTSTPTPTPTTTSTPTSTPTPTPTPTAAPVHGWVVTSAEHFDAPLPAGAFGPDPVPDDGPFADAGSFFTLRGVTPPAAFRATVPFSADGWLTLESYTRQRGAALSDQADVVADPADPRNRVLRIRSPHATDATIVRPSAPLPARYRISLRVGYADFGDGMPGLNGYTSATETAGPWWPDALVTSQNGFYWLSILDQLPRPHNNTWIHHHRKVVIDSDSHYPPWLQTWSGSRWLDQAERPVDLIALDGSQPGTEKNGPPFFTWAAGAWQPSGAIRAVDAYLPNTWYQVTIERDGPRYTLTASGRFRYGGDTTYRASIDAAARCVFHYPVNADEAAGAARCADPGSFSTISPAEPRWPAGAAWPDWFVFGDPHANYYQGSVLYDDVVLETWRD
jgi:hypothetical protein